jgi:hypothetical protein
VQGLGGNVQAIIAGGDYSCALVGTGAMCWGANSDGQLGNNSTMGTLLPVSVENL